MSREVDSIVVQGPQRTIAYAVRLNGDMPARRFLEQELDAADRAKILALMQRMAETGEIRNREQFKKVQDSLYEFKKHQVRVFCFREGDWWYLTNGYRKKKDKLDLGEVYRALDIMKEHRQRSPKKG